MARRRRWTPRGCSRVLPARDGPLDGTLFVDRLRGLQKDLIVRGIEARQSRPVLLVRIVFFGTPDFAVPSLEGLITSAHTVVGVVTQPDRPRGRGQQVTDSPVKAIARAHGLSVLQPTRLRDTETMAALSALSPELGVVAAYGKLIPGEMLKLPRQGMIDVRLLLPSTAARRGASRGDQWGPGDGRHDHAHGGGARCRCNDRHGKATDRRR